MDFTVTFYSKYTGGLYKKPGSNSKVHTTEYCCITQCAVKMTTGRIKLGDKVQMYVQQCFATKYKLTRSENCRKFVPANRRPHKWKVY